MHTEREIAHSVTSLDGVQLSARVWGTGRIRYLLIHGFGENSHSWAPFARAVAHDGAVMAVDLRGHGDSGRDPDGRYAPERWLEDIGCILREHDLRDIVLIGHSMGAALAIHVAERWPEVVQALVLVDGGPHLRRSAVGRIREDFDNQCWEHTSVAEYAAWLSSRLPRADVALLEEIAENALRGHPGGRWELKCDRELRNAPACIDDEALSAVLARVTCPTLLVRGAASPLLSRAGAAKLIGGVADGYLASVPHAGHFVMLENPNAFLEVVQSFIRMLHERAMGAHGSRVCASPLGRLFPAAEEAACR